MKIQNIFLMIIFFTFSFSFKCGHDKIKTIPKIVNNSIIRDNKTRRLDNIYHPISFYVDYTQFDKSYVNNEYKKFLKSAINSTLEIFSNLIKVKRTGKISIPNPTECSFRIKNYSRLVKEGVDNDVILYPIIDKNLEEGVTAAAISCFLDEEDNRPIMGYVVLRSNYSYKKKNAKEYLIMLLLHEITHILVFDDYLYDFYKFKGNVTITKIINGVNRTLIATPKVKDIASQHFNCSSLEGVELENQGGEGSAGSHWEARVMLGDYMISTEYQEIEISDITLALFEDSGWYEVNYYTGGLFRFGKGLGCKFLNSTCVTSGKSNFEWEFCTSDILEDLCTSNNLNRGFCFLTEYDKNEIETHYQYFDNPIKGGEESADYCPVVIDFLSEDYYFGTNCMNGELYYGEKYYPSSLGFSISENSICIQSSLVNSSDSSLRYYNGKKRAMCHEISCNYDNETFTVNIGQTTIDCPTEGGEIEVEGYNGTIKCPPYNRVCTSETYTGDPIKAVLNHLTNSDLDYSFKYTEDSSDNEIFDIYDFNEFLFISIYKYLLILVFLF